MKTYFYLASCKLLWQVSLAVISTFGLQSTLQLGHVCKAIVFSEIVRNSPIVRLDRREQQVWKSLFFHAPKLLYWKLLYQEAFISIFTEDRKKGSTLHCASQTFNILGWEIGPYQSQMKEKFFKEKFLVFFPAVVNCLGLTVRLKARLISSSLRLSLY